MIEMKDKEQDQHFSMGIAKIMKKKNWLYANETMNINSWKGVERNKERSTDDPRQDDMKTTNMKR